METSETNHRYGIVDMGSNGIRFSITSLLPRSSSRSRSPSTARLLPTLYQSRSAISLYDAQFPATTTSTTGTSPPPFSSSSSASQNRLPIPPSVIDGVLAALRRFQSVCRDFAVPGANIRVLATEATRTAVNAEEFRRRIRDAVGWEVEVLGKEEEGRVGAWGIASGFRRVEGLVMDLGGGSCQITWMTACDGKMQMNPKGAFSFPYGAAAMTRALAETATDAKARAQLVAEMQQNFQQAYEDLEIPSELLRPKNGEGERGENGLTLYLSGGGFRGWGYLLMSQSPVNPYPIPIINGFSTHIDEFQSTATIQNLAATEGNSTFRISKRRAAQVPAVAFLVQNLVKAIPATVKRVRFCQGGVREGYLFNLLSEEVRAQEPLLAASAQHAPPSAKEITDLISSAMPVQENDSRDYRPQSELVRALANSMYLHRSYPKDSAPAAALHSTTHGSLGAAHGVSHEERASLALMLCERWGAELPPGDEGFRERLAMLLRPEEVWWCAYAGRVAALVGNIYPAGVVRAEEGRRIIGVQAELEDGMGKRGIETGVKLTLRVREKDAVTGDEALTGSIEDIQKLGKKKNWIGGKAGWGLRVSINIIRESL